MMENQDTDAQHALEILAATHHSHMYVLRWQVTLGSIGNVFPGCSAQGVDYPLYLQ